MSLVSLVSSLLIDFHYIGPLLSIFSDTPGVLGPYSDVSWFFGSYYRYFVLIYRFAPFATDKLPRAEERKRVK